MNDKRPLSLTFSRIAELALTLGAAPMSQYENCWEHQVNEDWWIAVNGHSDSRKCSKDVTVPAWSAYLEFNGWPAGIIDPYGGVIAAGELANEDAFLVALESALLEAA